MAGLKRIFVVGLLIVSSYALSTCVNPLLDTVRIMVEESTDPLRVTYQPAPGTYTTPQSVQLSASKASAVIRYTTDDSEPTATNGTLYAGAFDVGASTTIRARAFLDPYSPSEVAVGAFTIPFGGQTKKTALTLESGAEFGWAVAIDGDYAIVGAPYEDGAGSNRGAAYIFHRTGPDTWDTGIKIIATNPTDEHAFGFSVDIDGDYAIVGTQNWLGRTSAYIYHRTGPDNAWDGGVKIDTTSPQDYGYFGDAVAINGDYAAVGAFGEDGNNTDSGAAYIFHRTGTNAWSAPQKVIGFDSLSNDAFGHTLSIAGDYVIVGAPWYNSIGPSPLSDVGTAYGNLLKLARIIDFEMLTC